eukprot:SAG31_NODE_236_length_19594_cov_7.018620_18_plen_406_part_00
MQLKQTLLEVDGWAAAITPSPSGASHLWDHRELLSKGKLWSEALIKIDSRSWPALPDFPSTGNRSHGNCIALRLDTPDQAGYLLRMCTGYALDTDGVWRHHSWMLKIPVKEKPIFEAAAKIAKGESKAEALAELRARKLAGAKLAGGGTGGACDGPQTKGTRLTPTASPGQPVSALTSRAGTISGTMTTTGAILELIETTGYARLAYFGWTRGHAEFRSLVRQVYPHLREGARRAGQRSSNVGGSRDTNTKEDDWADKEARKEARKRERAAERAEKKRLAAAAAAGGIGISPVAIAGSGSEGSTCTNDANSNETKGTKRATLSSDQNETDENGRQIKKKRSRAKYTDAMRAELERSFLMKDRPGPEEVQRLATELGLETKGVRKWFDNRRKNAANDSVNKTSPIK